MGLLCDTINELERPAILLGNGLNLLSGTLPSWNDLLAEIGGVDIESDGLTNTELYDFIDFKTPEDENLKYKVGKFLELKEYVSLEYHKKFVDLCLEKKCPVLTTNFDFSLFKAGDLKLFRTNNGPFTDFYPWDMYYAKQEHQIPTDGFGIWHIHGKLNYYRSIRLGLTDYMGSVEKARRYIHKADESIYKGKNQNNWDGIITWLHIWFNMPLVIVGFGLGSDEVFIRWLLIERKKYYRKFPNREKKTVYLSKGGEENRVENFLSNLDIKHIQSNDYEALYC